jgi:hypothetical protein
MKKKIVESINNILKNSLIKPPIFNEKRFLNTGECVDFISTALTQWNTHSWLSCDYDVDSEIEYGTTISGYLYILFTSPTKKYSEYNDYYDYIKSDQYQNFVLASYSDSFIQVLTQLYPFLPDNKKIKFRLIDQIRMSVEIIKNKFSVTYKDNSYAETIPDLGKIEFENLILYLDPRMTWLAHFFADDDRVKVYSSSKTGSFIPVPSRTATDKRILLQAKIDDQKKEKFINYNDLPKLYWPDQII